MWFGLLALFLWVIIGSLTPTFVKFTVRDIPPITLTFFRFLIAAFILFPFYWRERQKHFTRNQIAKLISIGLLGTALNATLYAYGLQFTSTIIAQVIFAVTPLVVAILGFFLIKETPTRYQIFGAVLGFIGILFILSKSIQSQNILEIGTPYGNGIIVLTMITWAFYTVLSRDLSKFYSPITITFWGFVSAAFLLGFASPIELIFRNISLEAFSLTNMLEIFFLGCVSSVITFLLYQFGIKQTSAFIASLALFLSPIAVAIPGVIVLKENVTPTMLIGILLIFVGVFLGVVYSHLKKQRTSVLQ